jgi:hypothetical protein
LDRYRWQRSFKEIIRYLCEYKFGWQKEKIPRSVNDDTFKNYHLIGGISICYQGSVLNAMLAAYPEFTKEDFKGTALYDQQRKRYKDPAKEYPGVNMDFNNMTDDQLQNDLGLEPEKDYKQVANKIKRRLLKM